MALYYVVMRLSLIDFLCVLRVLAAQVSILFAYTSEAFALCLPV
jgi:hypothetical protein